MPNLSLIGGVLSFFQGVFSYVFVAGLGAGLGLLMAVIGRAFGFVVAAVAGAVILVALYAADAVDGMAEARAQAEIAALQAAVTAKARKVRELAATNAQLNEFMDKGREAAAHNATVMAELRAEVERRPIPEECGWPKEFMQDVEKLR